ncbi:hypothetical protein HZS_8141 [Henneguya salminicola]|nr:hypothetical protein HZS_8141 [Henneguya salminicola]
MGTIICSYIFLINQKDRIFSRGEILEKHIIDGSNNKMIGACVNLNAKKYLDAEEYVEISLNPNNIEDSTNLVRKFSITSPIFAKSFASQYTKRMKRVEIINHKIKIDELYPKIFDVIKNRKPNKY